MSDGELRRELVAQFGDFFTARGFAETDYLYDANTFGNEVLELTGPGNAMIRFVRDRGQIFAELKKRRTWPFRSRYVGTHLLFRRLGVDISDHAVWPESGFRKSFVGDLMFYWDRLIALL